MSSLSKYTTILLALAVLAAILMFNQGSEAQRLDTLKITTGYVLLFLILLLGLQVAFNIAISKIDLSHLLSDSEGFASMGRFQLLVFTIVVALSFFLVVLDTRSLPDIPTSVLTLLGISASTFAVSKSVDAGSEPPGKSDDKKDGKADPEKKVKGSGDGI